MKYILQLTLVADLESEETAALALAMENAARVGMEASFREALGKSGFSVEQLRDLAEERVQFYGSSVLMPRPWLDDE